MITQLILSVVVHYTASSNCEIFTESTTPIDGFPKIANSFAVKGNTNALSFRSIGNIVESEFLLTFFISVKEIQVINIIFCSRPEKLNPKSDEEFDTEQILSLFSNIIYRLRGHI